MFRHVVGSREDLLQFASGTSITYTDPIVVVTDGKLARLLGCDELRRWYFMEGTRIDDVDARPIGITSLYVDASRAVIPPGVDFEHKPIHLWLEKTYGIRVGSVSQDISAVLLGAKEAATFGERPGLPALRIIRRYFDPSNALFQISLTTNRSEDFIHNTMLRFEE